MLDIAELIIDSDGSNFKSKLLVNANVKKSVFVCAGDRPIVIKNVPLLMALSKGHIDIAQKLIENDGSNWYEKLNVDVQADKENISPLYLAVSRSVNKENCKYKKFLRTLLTSAGKNFKRTLNVNRQTKIHVSSALDADITKLTYNVGNTKSQKNKNGSVGTEINFRFGDFDFLGAENNVFGAFGFVGCAIFDSRRHVFCDFVLPTFVSNEVSRATIFDSQFSYGEYYAKLKPKTPEGRGDTAFHLAVREGKYDIVKSIVATMIVCHVARFGLVASGVNQLLIPVSAASGSKALRSARSK